MEMKGHSKTCADLTTYFSNSIKRCVPCPKPGLGRETTPNCGFDDDGGRHEAVSKHCPGNTFNDGTRYYCRPCGVCAQGFAAAEPCSAQADTKCQATEQPTTVSYGPTTNPDVSKIPAISWVVSLTCIICVAILALSCWFICRKREYRRAPRPSAQSTSFSATQTTNKLKDVLSPDILAAPLKCVLDNLDVLEELIVLLDPEIKGIKNTKHLASLCSFSSNWVTYTYSLKDTKSPLRVLLECVSCRHPDWTVGHLGLLLWQIERVDAVEALSKLNRDILQIVDV